MALDTMPPADGEEFPDLPEMQPPLAVDFPAHSSLWCKIHYIREPDHKPCPGTCDGHGTGQLCGQLCLCYCHSWPGSMLATLRRAP